MTRAPKKYPQNNFTAPHFRPVAIALGQLALEWNDLHETLSLLFCSVMHGGYANQFLAIWQSLKVDRAKREILLAALESDIERGLPKPCVDDIKWLCGRIDVLEEEKNNALHSPFWSTGDKIVPVTGLGHVRARKLAEKENVINEFRWCRDRTLDLKEFASQMNGAMGGSGKPWPKRPPWPKSGHPNAQKQPPRAQKAKRPPPPAPSQA
jgi:hypothetical protein